MGLFGIIKRGLEKTKQILNTDIRDLFKKEGRLVDDTFLEELFASLIRTDMGVEAAKEIREETRKEFRGRVVFMEDLTASVKVKLKEIMRQDSAPVKLRDGETTVIMVCGVNGSGKTTSIAKLTKMFRDQGKSVVLGAADTFRAAAVEQLTVWAGRLGAEIVTGKPGCDPAYVERIYRRYRDIPWDILETERCFLRETVPDDVDAFYEIYGAPEMTRYTEDLYESKISERAYIREYIEKIYHYFEFGVWTVVLKETGEIIGRAGLNVREGYDMPELGYVIGRPWQGKGVATEVCRGILEYAASVFGFERIMTLIQAENEKSLHIAKRLGFRMQETVTRKESAKDMSAEREIKYWLLIWQAQDDEVLPEKEDTDVYSG